MDQLGDQLTDATIATARALVGITATSMHAAAGDLTLIQFRALVLLATRGTLTISALADAMSLASSSSTRLVERLERKSLVYRRRSTTSRREVNVHLAAKGRRYVEAVMADRRERVRTILSDIPERKQSQMLRAFREFATAAGEPLDPPPYG